MDEQFAVLVCASCKTAKEHGNYCGKCGTRLSEVTVSSEMIHERTIPEWSAEKCRECSN